MDRWKIPPHILDDLCSRFILNVPEEYKQHPIRIFFQIELAHWFYLDFYCVDQQELKACGIKDFSAQIFRHCPSLKEKAGNVEEILQDWKLYKLAVPTYGAIVLDPQLEHCLLVQGFCSKSTWSFPKGKVNEEEEPYDCAIREVLEETGYNISDKLKIDEYVEYQLQDQINRLYVVPGVPLNTIFEPQTRNEIRKVQWFAIDQLPTSRKDVVCKEVTGFGPNSFFMVLPFLKELRKWIAHKKASSRSIVCGDSSVSNGGSTSATKMNKKERSAKDLTQLLDPSAEHARGAASDIATVSDRQRQRQAQYFEEQTQVHYQELLGVSEAIKGPAAVAAIPGRGSGSGRKELQQSMIRMGQKGQRNDKDPSPALNKKPLSILQRDGSTTNKSSRKSLAGDFHSSATAKSQTLLQAPRAGVREFFSVAWDNFKFDYDDILRG